MAAYACEPSQGSEPAVGWHWAHEAASAGHEVWVVTRSNNRAAIERALATGAGQLAGDGAADGAGSTGALHFEYLDLPGPVRRLKHRLGHPGLLAYYYLWQVALIVMARRLHRRVGFDIAHHVTFVNDSLPSGLCALPIPFIWGPVGGSTHQLPKQVDLDLPPYARRHELVRSLLQRALGRMDPFVLMTRRRARLILVYTVEALAGLNRAERRRARAIVHIGIDPPARSGVRSTRAVGPGRCRVLCGGRLVHWKGLDMLIEGFARFVRGAPEVDARLTITGDGPYRASLEALARREGVDGLVEFVGLLPQREDALALMQECDLYALPTLRDGPPVALLEAMAHAVPVLCLDLGATAELVPDGGGIKIEPRSREFVIAEIARACAWVSEHPEQSTAMAELARRHVEQKHRWGAIRDEIERAYAELAPLRPPLRPGDPDLRTGASAGSPRRPRGRL